MAELTRTDATMCNFRRGSVTRRLSDKLDDMLSVKDFGAVGNGSTDDTAALNSALGSGRKVRVPVGTYKTTTALTCTTDNSGLVGEGRGSIIAPSNTTGNVFTLGDGSAEVSGLLFRDLVIWPSAAKTTGYAFHAQKVTDSLWSNVRIGSIDGYVANSNAHRLYHGIYFDRFSQNVWEGGEIVVSQDAVLCRGNADQSFGAELSIGDGLRIYKAGGVAIRLGGGAGGVYLGRMDASECAVGVQCDNTLQSGTVNRELFLQNGCSIDLATTYGINVEDNGLVYFEGDGFWVSGCGTAGAYAGIRIAPSTGSGIEYRASNAQVKYNYGSGFEISEGWVQIDGGSYQNNGRHANGGHGIHISGGADVSFCQIHGAACFSNGNGAKGYGIKLSSALTNVSVQHNTLFSNGQGGISSDTTINNPAIIVRNNAGAITENSGYATMLSGQSSVTVAHGLMDTPNRIELWWGSAPPAGAQLYAATSEADATNVILRATANMTGDTAIGWRVVRGSN